MEPKVRYEQVEPDPIWMTIDGVFFPLTGPVAFFYRWFQTMDCEESAKRELYPWIMGARAEWLKKREAVTAPSKSPLSQPCKGNNTKGIIPWKIQNC